MFGERKLIAKIEALESRVKELEGGWNKGYAVPIYSGNTFIDNKYVPLQFVVKELVRCNDLEFVRGQPDKITVRAEQEET